MWGVNPRKQKLWAGSPESTSAMMQAAAPGIMVTSNPSLMAMRTSE